MPINREELLIQMYELFNNRNADGILASMTENVDWPNGWEGGNISGKGAVRDYWLRQWEAIDPIVEPQEFLDLEDGRVQVTVHQTVKDTSGAVLDDRTVLHLYSFEDDRIRGMEIHIA